MKTLVVGASGATGQQLVEQLLHMEHKVIMIVRSTGKLPETWKNNKDVSIIQAGISEISEEEMADYVKECQAVACPFKL